MVNGIDVSRLCIYDSPLKQSCSLLRDQAQKMRCDTTVHVLSFH